MNTYKLTHLKTGWKDLEFENKVQAAVDAQSVLGYDYKDIKVSSSTDDCMLIFKRQNIEVE